MKKRRPTLNFALSEPDPVSTPVYNYLTTNFDPNEVRDDHGKWGSGGTGGTSSAEQDGSPPNLSSGQDHVGKQTGTEPPFIYPHGFTPPKSSSPKGTPVGPNLSVPSATRPHATPEEAKALAQYADVGTYYNLNKTLRDGGALPKVGALGRLFGGKDLAGVHEQMQKLFARTAVTDTPMTLKRGLDLKSPDELGQKMLNLANGGVVKLPGYQSTSSVQSADSKGGFVGNFKFTIHAVHGIDMSPYSTFPDEKEVLLNHASEYKVGKVEKAPDGKWSVELFQLPPKKGVTTNEYLERDSTGVQYCWIVYNYSVAGSGVGSDDGVGRGRKGHSRLEYDTPAAHAGGGRGVSELVRNDGAGGFFARCQRDSRGYCIPDGTTSGAIGEIKREVLSRAEGTKWTEEGNRFVSTFKTSAGLGYRIVAKKIELFGGNGFSVSFADDRHDDTVTGAGNAKEVFGHVTAAVVGLMGRHDSDVIEFAAADTKNASRARLYTRLTRFVTSTLPGYSALSTEGHDGETNFYVFKKGMRSTVEGNLTTKRPTIITNVSGEIDPSWFIVNSENRVLRPSSDTFSLRKAVSTHVRRVFSEGRGDIPVPFSGVRSRLGLNSEKFIRQAYGVGYARGYDETHGRKGAFTQHSSEFKAGSRQGHIDAALNSVESKQAVLQINAATSGRLNMVLNDLLEKMGGRNDTPSFSPKSVMRTGQKEVEFVLHQAIQDARSAGYAAGRGITTNAFDPNQAREPAGQPGGGQFASGSGSSGDGGKLGEQGSGGSKKAFTDQAEKVKWTTDRIDEVGNINRTDYDEIENVLDRSESEDLDRALEDAKDSYVDSAMEDYEPHIEEYDVAKDAGWDDSGISDKVQAAFDDVPDDEWKSDTGDRDYWKDKVNKWYRDTSEHGMYGLKELRSKLGDDNAPEHVIKAVSDTQDTARNDIEKAEDEARDKNVEDRREYLGEKFDGSDDEEEVKRDWLRGFWDAHVGEDRFNESSGSPNDTWGKDGLSGAALQFSAGNNAYRIEVRPNPITPRPTGDEVGDGQTHYVTFEMAGADGGEFGVTGTGSAKEVFTHVVGGMMAYVQKKNPTALTFSAYTPSRQKLYDRLVRTVATMIPGYVAGYVDTNESDPKERTRYYAVIKQSQKVAGFKQLADAHHAVDADLKVLVNRLSSEISPEPVLLFPYSPDSSNSSNWQEIALCLNEYFDAGDVDGEA